MGLAETVRLHMMGGAVQPRRKTEHERHAEDRAAGDVGEADGPLG